MHRRHFLSLGAASGLASMSVLGAFGARSSAAATGVYEVTHSKAEWKAMLSNLQYKVMREESTERAGSSPLDKNYSAGTYHCRGCDLALYSSKAKYDSGTGWPSFYQSLPKSIGTKEDRKFFSVRTECHCRRCGSHLGHIFTDGPKPTGKRHCLNGVSLVFKAG
jgi:peptide-methionine (R)-S-oxide reductase